MEGAGAFISAPTTFTEDAAASLASALEVTRKFGAVRSDLLPFGGSLCGLNA